MATTTPIEMHLHDSPDIITTVYDGVTRTIHIHDADPEHRFAEYRIAAQWFGNTNNSRKGSQPMNFWQEIDDQLNRITTEKPVTFDEVRAILHDPKYQDIATEINRNGTRYFDADHGFFAGSGGDDDLYIPLYNAGWKPVIVRESYYYSMYHPYTQETLTYTEGDVQRGDLLTPTS